MNHDIVIRYFTEKDLEYIIDRHQEIYKQEYGFDNSFRDYVGEAVMAFKTNHDKTRENIWIAELNGKAVGVIALLKVDYELAQLRWFLIEQEIRGQGIGRKLINTLIDFARDQNYKQIMLWTISMLDAAHHLYDTLGFTLTDSNPVTIWGKNLIEERWDLTL